MLLIAFFGNIQTRNSPNKTICVGIEKQLLYIRFTLILKSKPTNENNKIEVMIPPSFLSFFTSFFFWKTSSYPSKFPRFPVTFLLLIWKTVLPPYIFYLLLLKTLWTDWKIYWTFCKTESLKFFHQWLTYSGFMTKLTENSKFFSSKCKRCIKSRTLYVQVPEPPIPITYFIFLGWTMMDNHSGSLLDPQTLSWSFPMHVEITSLSTPLCSRQFETKTNHFNFYPFTRINSAVP